MSYPRYVDVDLARRIEILVDHVDLPANCFPIAHVPLEAQWGGNAEDDPNLMGVDLSKVLCYCGRPIKVRMVVLIHSVWFYAPNEEPHRRVNMGFKFFRPLDLHCAQRVLFHKANPMFVPKESIATMYTARLISRRTKGELTQPFERVYDATTAF
ncbi:hypothetical protein OBBRIDRAFT_892189 [Obba rivulosa]|uniref:Uncharacterized protein n=1 Tax=Obba rivulosa TaxID=1052685 RepID=A0A8E2DDB8_9APHY|nr:hypothetical protein OBBRIDRAFT_892189 [Obba rivulosa]